MTLIQAIVLGIVQGLTEFLPISSSAHLILVPRLFGWPDQGLHADIAANTGTLLAVVVYFRRDLRQLTGALLAHLRPAGLAEVWRGGWAARGDGDYRVSGSLAQARLAWGLLLGTIPAGLAGLLIYDWVASGARNLRLIGVELIVFAGVLCLADRLAQRRAEAGDPTRPVSALVFPDALLIGAAQALALLPGTSRSGITMSAGIFRGLSREAAARFAFLLSVPIGVLVAGKDAWEMARAGTLGDEVGAMLVVGAVSALTGLAVIHWLLGWLRRRSLRVFVVYRLALGALLLLLPIG